MDESKPDSIRAQAMTSLIWNGYAFRDTDSALIFVEELLNWTEEKKMEEARMHARNAKAMILRSAGRYEEAKALFNQNLELWLANSGNYLNIASTYNNLGLIYQDVGDLPKAIEHFIKAITKCEEAGDTNNVASPMNNIAMIYLTQGDISNAKAYFQKCQEIYARNGMLHGVAVSNQNLGVCALNEDEYDLALEYYRKGEEAALKSDHYQSLAQIYLGICNVLYDQVEEMNKAGERQGVDQKLKEAVIYAEKAIEVAERSGLKRELAEGFIKGGLVYDALGTLSRAEEYGNQGLRLGRELGSNATIRDASQLLYGVYKKMGNGNKALAMHELYMNSKDSVETAENEKEILRQQMKYEYDKERAVKDAAHEAELQHLNDLAELDKARHQVFNIAVGAGLLVVVIILLFVFIRYRSTRKQKEVTERQKLQVEEKNREITASITYAKRIQNAILPNTRLVKEHLKDSFIYYKPKDIVAGDFYWMDTIPGTCFFAAADCTGHGVPGAMVSVVCHNALNRSVREFGLTEPDQILNKTRELVAEHFEESDEEIKDGMDIALCALSGNTLKFAGANNPLWLVSAGNHEADNVMALDGDGTSANKMLYEFKGDKQPVGEHVNPKPFTQRTVNLTAGDTIYIFTDGYADQFGGDKGKKFKYRKLKELLGEFTDVPMEKQSALLDQRFEEWRGDLEQIDDVCFIGVRI